ncbi:SDR family oxidoreductase [Burkholderia aenigmatica]|uniref:Short-chain dehydrogenase n=1 Tax=Burkholderia aenigmatica TaxID=2015348 RepID=A0A228IN85_9BURK|nr:SDR family oxidoreductase [Burkholderia aenigmatica]OXI43838.1 short-chain dehydrogenase [Burkholderia aenigmatica]
MKISFHGRVLIVTGGTQGVGRAIANQFAEAGGKGVVLTGRNVRNGEAAAREIESRGCAAEFVEVDLGNAASAAMIVQRCLTKFGQVDALVNAAGMTDRASVLSATSDVWDRLFAVNAKAPTFLMQECIKAMTERGLGGAIVNILSMNAHLGKTDLAIYASTKAALALLTKNAAHAHRFDRIRINGINMGWADTPGEREMQANILSKGDEWLKNAAAQQPFGRLLSSDDVARLAIFLLSDTSSPMTGALVDQEQWVFGGDPGRDTP